MSKREKTFSLLFIIPAVVMLLWKVWPQKMVERTFSYDENAMMAPLQSCLISSGISTGDWKISYPESIEFKETGVFILTYFPSTQVLEARNPMEDCQMLLVSRMEVEGATVEPGETIFTPFDRDKVGRITWKLAPTGEEIFGKLWIYAQTNTGEGQAALFAIPVKIRAGSILGVQPDVIRMLIAGLSLSGTLSIWIRWKRKTEWYNSRLL
jgi:hypothetical protein